MTRCIRDFSYLLVLIVYSTMSADAGDTNIDLSRSSLVATFREENVPVEAPFRRFSGRVDYDPSNVAAATATLDVDTGSLDIGDPSYNAETRKPSWFDSQRFPNATFQSTTITAGASGSMLCVGVLTIKGISKTVKVPIGIQKSSGGAVFDGTMAVSRKAYGIGAAEWDGILEDTVVIKFHITSSR